MIDMWQFILAGMLGAILGVSELLAKYTDAPLSALKNLAALFYIIFNACLSMLAIYLISGADISVPQAVGDNAKYLAEIIAAGAGAAAILRIGVSIQVSGETVNVTLMKLVQPILDAALAELSRAQAIRQAEQINLLMPAIPLDSATKDLPALCAALVPEMSAEEKQAFEKEISDVNSEDIQEDTKKKKIGVILLRKYGRDVVEVTAAALVSPTDRGARTQPSSRKTSVGSGRS